MFFADLAQMTPRSQESLEAMGRKVLASLIAPDDQSAKARLDVLGNDTVWAAMDQQGGTDAFSNLPYFAHLNLIERNLIAADWADIVWWATSMTKVAELRHEEGEKRAKSFRISSGNR